MRPWQYLSDGGTKHGRAVWDAHQFWEDRTNTVYCVERNMASPDTNMPQLFLNAYPDLNPDVILLNRVLFWPPEGVELDASNPSRRLLLESIYKRGIQLYVNHSWALTDPESSLPARFGVPSFFTNFPVGLPNAQVPSASRTFKDTSASATRLAFGVLDASQGWGAHSQLDQHDEASDEANAIYVTASIGYGLLDIDQADRVMLDDVDGESGGVWTDRLFVRNEDDPFEWDDRSERIDAAVRNGNSSGVAFADFNGDGYMDLYVGKQGDNYLGAPNVLLIFNTATGDFDDMTATKIVANGQSLEFDSATTDVVAADVTGDGLLDLIVANRCRRDGPCGSEADDFILINSGGAVFDTRIVLGPGVLSDSRSLAVGDIDGDGVPEIVIGNADAGEFSNDLGPASSVDQHLLQIFARDSNGMPPVFSDHLADYVSAADEATWTSPPTWQVLLKDVVGPYDPSGDMPTFVQDGKLDLILVGHRDILADRGLSVPGGEVQGSRVVVLANECSGGQAAPFTESVTTEVDWASSVAFANFAQEQLSVSAPALPDMFVGTSSRYAGTKAQFEINSGVANEVEEEPGRYTPWAATTTIGGVSYPTVVFRDTEALPGSESGYGFDFVDLDGDGFMDVVQAARGYSYFVRGLGDGGHLPVAEATHENLVDGLDEFSAYPGPGSTNNKRGTLTPLVNEDAVFADFNEDGRLDLLVASTIEYSFSLPVDPDVHHAAETLVLVGAVSSEDPFDFTFDLTDLPGNGPRVDARIDPKDRVASPYPNTADRAFAADMDCDGDVDALVPLFAIDDDAGDQIAVPLVQPPAFGSDTSLYAFGFRYLENIYFDAVPLFNPNPGSGGSIQYWFKDVAAERMFEDSALGGDDFKPYWNRGRNQGVLADFDNNGGMDFFNTKAVGDVSEKPEDVALQTRNLLFLNGVDSLGASVSFGDLVECGELCLPAPCVALDWGGDPGPDADYCPSFGVAAGDIDNDGDTDLVLAHPRFFIPMPPPFAQPELFINRLDEAVCKFVDEFEQRVPMDMADDIIHSLPHPDQVTYPGHVVDHADFPALGDFDGDGDVDLVFHVKDNVPRFWRNLGQDFNGDGVIDGTDQDPVTDEYPVGTFMDVTAEMVGSYVRPSTDSQDLVLVDVDGDGDLDLANDAYADLPLIWRNDLGANLLQRPVVTEIWPRLGAVRGKTVRIVGTNFPSGRYSAQLRFKGGTEEVPLSWLSPTELLMTIPDPDCETGDGMGLGRAQVRVARHLDQTLLWSLQYFGYDILFGGSCE